MQGFEMMEICLLAGYFGVAGVFIGLMTYDFLTALGGMKGWPVKVLCVISLGLWSLAWPVLMLFLLVHLFFGVMKGTLVFVKNKNRTRS